MSNYHLGEGIQLETAIRVGSVTSVQSNFLSWAMSACPVRSSFSSELMMLLVMTSRVFQLLSFCQPNCRALVHLTGLRSTSLQRTPQTEEKDVLDRISLLTVHTQF